ncbi:MAG: hypothetical protein ACREIS_14330 [Nitrospiraceae bacterium]
MQVETGDALEVLGTLVSQLKLYSSKLPAVVSLSVVPGGYKPSPEAVAAYEQAIYRFREQAGASAFRRLYGSLVESLEAFEAGWVLKAVQSLLLSLDLLELMQREKAIRLAPDQEGRLREYRSSLQKILPGKNPELEGAGKGL